MDKVILTEMKFAINPGSHLISIAHIAAINLRCIPPVRFGVHIGRRLRFVAGRAGWIRHGSQYLHLRFRPSIVFSQGDYPWTLLNAPSMAEPISDLKLQP